MAIDWTLTVMAVVEAVGAGMVGTFIVVAVERAFKARPATIFADDADATIFLFDGEMLVDSTPSARALLAASATMGGPWIKILSYLSPYFPDFERRIPRLAVEGSVMLVSVPEAGSPMMLQAEMRGGMTRLMLIDPENENQAPAQDLMTMRAMTDELDFLRTTVSKAPILIWRERANGDVIWANGAYLLRVGDVQETGHELSWPLPRLFERTASTQGIAGQRQKLTLGGGRAIWYDMSIIPEAEGRLAFALPADAAVQAEAGLRDFMQTLTKTFAHLHVGLAIFDDQRQLQLFNPALLDLTGLPVDFLSMRPSLLSVLDAMRDRNMIPEPKDYRGWRRQLVELEKAAASGLYEETWSLPGGQTYRVIGRPHPNGAIALMIEDISGEMLRTRRYRADLELGQAVIDQLGEAIAVFSEGGQLVMSNTAYAALWGADPGKSLDDASLRSLCSQWRAQTAVSPVWNDLEDFASNQGDRAAWAAEARLLDGRLIDCRFAPLAAGATLAGFRVRELGSVAKTLLTDTPDLLRA